MKICRKRLHTYNAKLTRCPECTKISQAKYRATSKGRQRQAAHQATFYEKHPDYRREKLYKLPVGSVKALLEKQGCKCAICAIPINESSQLDHCHETGKVRGMLCTHCNRLLGFAKDKPSILRAAAYYLEK